jgi:2,3-bisphosphoglycerate-dependent phosphoglycerate mutase
LVIAGQESYDNIGISINFLAFLIEAVIGGFLMRLYLIRHCESENNFQMRQTGRKQDYNADPRLTPLGHEQAMILGSYLAGKNLESKDKEKRRSLQRRGFGFSHLFCSLMTRSIETGIYIANTKNIPLVALIDIHERGGLYFRNPDTDKLVDRPSLNHEYFTEKFPQLVLPAGINESGWWNLPYESEQVALDRAKTFLDQLVAHHGQTKNNIALVTHSGFLQSILQVLFGARETSTVGGLTQNIWFRANNGSITRIDFEESRIRLSYLNFIDYMPAELQT